MKRTCEAIVLIVLATTVITWAQGDAALKILDDARAALGGPALAAVKTLTATGKATRMSGDQTSTTDVEMALQRPDKFVRREVMPAVMGTQITRTFGFNGKGIIDAIDRGAPPPESSNSNMRVFASTPLQSAQTPERAAEIARLQLTKNYQEYSRFALGLFLDALPDYPLKFAAATSTGEPCGKADAVTVTGPDDLELTLFISRDSHRPACATFMAKEPMAPMVMGGGMAISAGGGLGVFAGGPVANAGRPQMSIAGTLSADMQAQIQAMQRQQEEAAAKRRTVEYRITYGDYRSFDGVQVPTRFKRLIDGKVVEEFTLDKVKVNPRIDPDKFAVTKVGGGTVQ